MIGQRVTPRRYEYCYDCKEETVQWLFSINTASPGSYRGTRIHANYVCSQCGEIEI